MSRPRPRRALAALALLATALTGALVPTSPAQADPAASVPQAPTFSVVAASETLPFTLAGGGAIEVAVLTGTQTPATASWTQTGSLALTSYVGQTIRVLARPAGVSDQARWFDSTYDVRPAYAAAVDAGTAGNTPTAIHGNDERFRAFAQRYLDYQPGTNVGPTWLAQAQSIVGSELPEDPSFGTGYEGNTAGLVLGDHGRITAEFRSPIRDGAGPDLAVFENGFRINGTADSDFLELARVEVSSDGVNFVRFDSATTHDAPIGGFEGVRAHRYGGLAGRDLNGYGTPFDLALLRNKPEVRDGTVDLQAITQVRLVDVVGDGADLDSFGRPIYDPHPTADSGGFDLGGIGVINQVAPSITSTRLVRTSLEGNASVYAAISAGTAAWVEPHIEFSQEADHSDAWSVGGAYVPAGDGYTAAKLDNWMPLEQGRLYWYRLVMDTPGGPVTTKWTQYSTVGAFEVTRRDALVYEDVAHLDVGVDPGLRGDHYEVFVEYGDLWGISPVQETEHRTVPRSGGATTLRFTFDDFPTGAYRKLDIVVEDENGTEIWRTTGASVLLPGERPGLIDAPAISGLQGRSATVDATALRGTYGPYDLHAEYTSDPTHTDLETTEPREITETVSITDTLEHLTPGRRYWVRYVSEPHEGDFRFTTDWVRFTTDAAPDALGTPTAGTPTRTGATVTVPVTADGFTRSVAVETTADPDLADAVSTPAQEVAADAEPATLSFRLTGLAPATSYWFRAVSRVGDAVETTPWRRLTTTGAEAATFPVSVSAALARTSTRVRVRASGLDAGEPYVVSVGGISTATATAGPAGTVDIQVVVPTALAGGRYPVVLTGRAAQRRGTVPLTVVTAARLAVSAKTTVRRGGRQTLTVRGLAPGERVTVTVRGKRVSPATAKANAKGTYTVTFKAGKKTGRATATVQGLDRTRTGSVAFRVVR